MLPNEILMEGPEGLYYYKVLDTDAIPFYDQMNHLVNVKRHRVIRLRYPTPMAWLPNWKDIRDV